MILLYHFSSYGARGDYFTGKEPAGVLCSECECVIDHDYIPKRVSIRRPYDVACTYDKHTIVNEAFKQFCEKEELTGVEFVLVNERRRLYLLRLHNVLRFDAQHSSTRFGKVCNKCGQHEFVVGFEPTRLCEVTKPIEHGLYRSDLLFGSTYARTPINFAGIETKRRIEAMRFRGTCFNPITDDE